jgi:ammonium transporter, Amt family
LASDNYIQLAIQLCDSVAGGTYSFGASAIILIIMSFIGRYVPAMRLRATKEQEELGIDDIEIGEFAYDYVELIRDVKPRDPAHDVSQIFEEDTDEGTSQRSHSQATMMNGAEKAMAMNQGYPMRTLNRDGTDLYGHSTSPIGTAS